MNSSQQVLVCQYINCSDNGSSEVLAEFLKYSELGITVSGCECQGQCNMGPTVRVLPDDIWYCRIQPADVPEIVEQHLKQGKRVDRLLHPRFHPKF